MALLYWSEHLNEWEKHSPTWTWKQLSTLVAITSSPPAKVLVSSFPFQCGDQPEREITSQLMRPELPKETPSVQKRLTSEKKHEEICAEFILFISDSIWLPQETNHFCQSEAFWATTVEQSEGLRRSQQQLPDPSLSQHAQAWNFGTCNQSANDRHMYYCATKCHEHSTNLKWTYNIYHHINNNLIIT